MHKKKRRRRPQGVPEVRNASQQNRLPKEGSEHFGHLCATAVQSVVAKYAWVATLDGIVLRRNPLKLRHRDREFNRVAKVEHGFRYIDRRGRKRSWYPDCETVFGLTQEGELDVGAIVVERVEFVPGKDEVTRDEDDCLVLNLWQRPCWNQRSHLPEPRPFLDHLAYLLGDDLPVNHVLDYLAHLVQKPWERVGHALLIVSEAKGIGKSTLGYIMRRLAGEKNSGLAQTKDLKGTFDGWLAGKLVIQVDEVYESGNWELANRLKPLITEATVSVNIKYGPQMQIRNYARFIMFSNHTAPLNLEEGDRRYFVVNCGAQPKEDAYYANLYGFIESVEGMDAIHTYLARRDLSRFNPYARPPLTEAKQSVIDLSGNPLRRYMADCVESGHFRIELKRPEFSLDELERVLQKDGYGQFCKNRRELSVAIELAGIKQFRRIENGTKKRLYRLPAVEGEDPATDDLY